MSYYGLCYPLYSPVPVRCHLTPVDSTVPYFHLDLGRIAAWAYRARTVMVLPGPSHGLEMSWDLISFHRFGLLDSLAHLLERVETTTKEKLSV